LEEGSREIIGWRGHGGGHSKVMRLGVGLTGRRAEGLEEGSREDYWVEGLWRRAQ
jgi:hypothetical protein